VKKEARPDCRNRDYRLAYYQEQGLRKAKLPDASSTSSVTSLVFGDPFGSEAWSLASPNRSGLMNSPARPKQMRRASVKSALSGHQSLSLWHVVSRPHAAVILGVREGRNGLRLVPMTSYSELISTQDSNHKSSTVH